MTAAADENWRRETARWTADNGHAVAKRVSVTVITVIHCSTVGCMYRQREMESSQERWGGLEYEGERNMSWLEKACHGVDVR